METYTDNEGRTVLERRIHTDTKGTEHLDTYYVYDDLNRLRYVLPPQAEEIFRQAGETRSGSDKGIADYAYAPCYNGNISSISWKAGEEQSTRGYRFTYDVSDGKITNATTYINPKEFTGTFATNTVENQDFWVQIGVELEGRRVMSAKQIPIM